MPLVGRAVETAALDAALDLLERGVGGTMLITGEPGIGKTALLAELGRRAGAAGCRVRDGRATEFERDDPYAVFRPIIGAATGDRMGALRTVRSLLAELAPVVLALDDLHWADAASIDLLGYLLRHPPDGPVLIAAALRAGGCPARLAVALDTCRHTELRPSALTRAEAAQLLTDVDPARLDDLHADSGGNPFYLRVLAASVRTAPNGPAPAVVPAAVGAALAAELRELTARARRAARAAAVAGDPFDAGLARAVAELDDDRFAVALDELVAAGLVAPTGEPWLFRFRHPIVRRGVYESAGPGWRRAAHARAAATLARRGAGPLARAHHVERSAEVGDRAAVELLTAAGHAASATAPAEAAHWFGVALALLPGDGVVERGGGIERGIERGGGVFEGGGGVFERGVFERGVSERGGDERGAGESRAVAPDGADERRAELLQALALAAGAAGRLADSATAVDHLLRLVPATRAADRVRLVALRMYLDHAVGRLEPARVLAHRELGALPPGARAGRAALHAELALNAFLRADYAAIRGHAGAAHTHAVAAGDSAARAYAAALMALGEHAAGRTGRAVAHLVEAAAIVDALPDGVLAGALPAVVALALAGYHLDRHADAIRHARRGLDLAEATGQVLVMPGLHVTRAGAEAFSGRLAAGLASATAAYDVAVLTGGDHAASLALGLSVWIHTWRGDVAVALARAEDARRRCGGSAMGAGNIGLFHAEALLEAGRADSAASTLLAAAGGPDLPRLERPWRTRAGQTLVRAAIATGDRHAALGWLEQARMDAAGVTSPACVANLRYAEAVVHFDGGALQEAAGVAGESATAADRAGRRVDAARARVLAGRALAAAGRRADAVTELRRAERDAVAIGAGRCREQAARELRRLGLRAAPHDGPHDAPAGPVSIVLSAREREVADLVAAGHTNRQIASRLVISDKTVEAHVSRILRKLRVPSRSAVGRVLPTGS
ncbi:helix-turn-helix transcriptional regulator [Virgisporangium aurantiacum]|uniref:HTH luxR-type domain-containing protein n=1 Tax=Virgisporangium aurantiacum TaxID=175570 RepID=A0A8J3Z4G4_9ACTN|nr:helix-turn-helix transcriptional regulator [Virgisporangium aurantiacum]GIJ55086.1 hypothetical protein Vau01_026020 [Virgisporangium aurantiacum]